MKCKHLHILVTRTYDLKCARPTCEDCGEPVPNWASRPHVSGKHTYRYRYVDPSAWQQTQEKTDKETT